MIFKFCLIHLKNSSMPHRALYICVMVEAAKRSYWIDNKKIYVVTYRMKDNKNELIILDLKGKILRRIFLHIKSLKDYKHFGEFDPNTVHNGILYELFDNEKAEMWELHKTNLSSVK